MYIGSSYNIKNKISSNPILINNIPEPRTGAGAGMMMMIIFN